MKNIFQDIGLRKPRRSAFDLSHQRKMSLSPGKCYPVMCHDTMPGDKFNHSVSALLRMMPMRSPIFHMVDCYSYTFGVPMRLCMQNGQWEVFITGGKDGDGLNAQGTLVEIPYFTVVKGGGDHFDMGNISNGTLADYLGIGIADETLATMGTEIIKINAMPFLAFWRIWCEYFRDQNLHPDYVNLYPSVFEAMGDITATLASAIGNATNPFPFFEVPAVCWRKDMLTSALPFAQRGAPVSAPLEGEGTVSYLPVSGVFRLDGSDPIAGDLSADPTYAGPGAALQSGGGTPTQSRIENIGGVELQSGGFTINALRLAARLQEWLERMARGGARYVEQTLSMWGVISSDARLQRPEFLAGGKIPVSISEVLQTSEDGTTPLAEMAGHGVSAGNVTHYNKFFEEHCYIISIFFMRPNTAYQQGIPRLFTQRFDKLDWPWWQFANLGEQEVLNKEVYFNADANDEGTFGYQQRLCEYKYIPTTVHGEFKTTLDFWHWGRKFATRPTLSKEFVECDPDSRIFNVIQDTDPLYAIINHKITAIRPLPYYGEPTL